MHCLSPTTAHIQGADDDLLHRNASGFSAFLSNHDPCEWSISDKLLWCDALLVAMGLPRLGCRSGQTPGRAGFAPNRSGTSIVISVAPSGDGHANPPGGRLDQSRLAQRLIRLVAITFLTLLPSLLVPPPAWALIHAHPDETTATGVVRSLESLRDLDYQSWQVVAYREGPPRPQAPITLRIVSYPGRVRLDHPTPLLVTGGRRLWELADTTLSSPKLAGDGRAAAAEFDLTPLLADLENNRPLRLELPGVFTELPVPPYVVKEWRSLPLWDGAEGRG